MAMGGRVAEELIFGKENVTSGAASDIQQVTKIARAMVTQFGFSEELGKIDYANEQQSYLGAYNSALERRARHAGADRRRGQAHRRRGLRRRPSAS